MRIKTVNFTDNNFHYNQEHILLNHTVRLIMCQKTTHRK